MTTKLAAAVAGMNELPVTSIKWSSSQSGIVTVDPSGTVTAIAPGTAMIYARLGAGVDSSSIVVLQREGLLATAASLTCGISTTGPAVCWNAAFAPFMVGINVTSIAISSYTRCHLEGDGTAFCMGNNYFGELGLGYTSTGPSYISQPRSVAGATHFLAVYSGGTNDDLASQCLDTICGYPACALTENGSMHCWGSDVFTASLTPSSPEPKPMTTSLRFASFGVGVMYLCGVTIEKKAYCAGNNTIGQLGRGVGTDRSLMPVAGDVRFEMISAGSTHVCAVAVGGTAYCWGSNDAGQLGAPSDELCPTGWRARIIACRTYPLQVSGGYLFKSVSAGSSTTDRDAAHPAHTCGITLDDSLLCWGSNAFGQLGNGTQVDSPSPVAVATSLRFRSVTTARTYTCAVTTTGAAMCWGSRSGQSPALTPQALAGGYTFR